MRLNSAARAGRRRLWWASAPLLTAGVLAGLVTLSPDRDVRISLPATSLLWLVGALGSAAWLGFVLVAASGQRRVDRAVGVAVDHARAEHRRFLDRLDHEIKNPLTAIRAGLAAHGVQGAPHLAAVEGQAVRLGALIAELRKLSHLQTQPLETQLLDLRAVADEAIATVQEQLLVAGTHRTLRVQFPEAPWHIAPIRADPDLLYLAVFNLVSNAAKFTTDADSVEVRAYEDAGMVILEVADTGLGIPAEDVESVWAELARASNARGVPGSGLGLSLVAVVARRHGGWALLESRVGKGTRVRMALPADPQPAEANNS